ncbi:MAG: NHL repeat containing protein, partial [Candidatus Magnetoglobus multicellularis str. Araruama]
MIKNFTITDAESSACGLTLSMASSDSTLFTDTNFTYTCSADTYILSITPIENSYGGGTITIIATDGGGLTASDSFSITVTEVNDAPTSTSISSLTLIENQVSSALSFTITDLESNAADLTVTASSSNTSLVDNSNIVIEGTGSSQTISITPTANEYGTVTITISITDGDLTATTAFMMTINNVLEISSINDQTTLEDIATGEISFTLTGVSSGGQTADYSFAYSFVESGTTELNMPWGIAVDSIGNIYVTDSFNHRIVVFTSSGTYSYSMGSGSSSSNLGEFNFPRGIYIDDSDKIYVADESNNRVQVFTSSFAYDYSIAVGGLAVEVFVDSNGKIYVGEDSTGSVKVYTSYGNYDFTISDVNGPTGISVDSSGKIYVVCNMDNAVKVYTSSGSLDYTFGGSGSSDGLFDTPSDIAINSDGKIFVSDYMNHRIQVFSNSGTFDYSIGTTDISGNPPDLFNYPRGFSFDNDDNLYITENANRIQVYTNNTQDGVTVFATSSYTPLVSSASITLGGSGGSRTIDISPAAEQSGTVSITVTATDGDLTATTSFQLTVTNVNDLPVISSI